MHVGLRGDERRHEIALVHENAPAASNQAAAAKTASMPFTVGDTSLRMVLRDGSGRLVAKSLPTITVTSLPVAAESVGGRSAPTDRERRPLRAPRGGSASRTRAPANVTLECSWISVAVVIGTIGVADLTDRKSGVLELRGDTRRAAPLTPLPFSTSTRSVAGAESPRAPSRSARRSARAAASASLRPAARAPCVSGTSESP